MMSKFRILTLGVTSIVTLLAVISYFVWGGSTQEKACPTRVLRLEQNNGSYVINTQKLETLVMEKFELSPAVRDSVIAGKWYCLTYQTSSLNRWLGYLPTVTSVENYTDMDSDTLEKAVITTDTVTVEFSNNHDSISN